MEPEPNSEGVPERHLSVTDAVSIIVGIVLGAGIFGFPPLVAGATGEAWAMLAAWAAGGLLCFCGALVYAELATTYPQVGGEVVYLRRGLGRPVSFLFVWSRATVIQTGSIAAAAYVFGIYMARLVGLHDPAAEASGINPAPTILAAAAVIVLAACNAIGLRAGRWAQNTLTATKVLGLVAVIAVGLLLADPAPPVLAQPAGEPGLAGFGFAMIFVLYTFGGWSESAYVAGEQRGGPRHMLTTLVVSLALLTGLYLLANLAYLRVLGMKGMAGSRAVAADVVAAALGRWGGAGVSLLVAVSALGSIDGCIFTGARAVCGGGMNHRVLAPLAKWHPRLRTPIRAIVVQAALTVVLILLPALTPGLREALGRDLEAAVAYTAPVFWLFLMLVGIAALILRLRDPARPRPFRVPLAPLIVGVFCLTCGYMLVRAVMYKTVSPIVGLCVLAAGLPLYLLDRALARRAD